ncbi:MAG: bifunctional riboflavin kinase/FAD synthetase [Oscillospiraceae bacterium]
MIVTHSLQMPALAPRSTCVALGLFDGLHRGHQAVLQATLSHGASFGLEPLCFTFSTALHTPQTKRGMTRLMSSHAMEQQLAQMGFAHMACPDFDEFRTLCPQCFLEDVLTNKLGAGAIVCGFDFRFGRKAAAGVEELSRFCREKKLELRIIPPVEEEGQPISSSRIRELVREGEIPAANRLLGRAFAIDFEVVSGRRLGHTLGWPTINQPFPADFTLPRFGVYATLTRLGETLYSSVTNVGVKPTVGSDQVLAETYIQDFEGNLYGSRVEVQFLQFLREEIKFSDLSALRAQIATDAELARKAAAPFLQK